MGVLVCQDLSYGYEPGRPVVTDISAALAPGRLAVIIGPNAAGKTTLLRLLLGQLPAWSGQALVEGAEVAALEPRSRAAAISYVPQRGTVNLAFSVKEVVAMGRHVLQRDDQAVEQAMAICQLQEHVHRVYAQLSTGQQQRVLLARAVAQSRGQGRAMLLDEPVSAMDLYHVHRTMRLLRDLAADGVAVLVILHDLNLAARYADDVWLLQSGQLAASGPWHKVLEPQRLESVYRVRLAVAAHDVDDRPVFVVRE